MSLCSSLVCLGIEWHRLPSPLLLRLRVLPRLHLSLFSVPFYFFEQRLIITQAGLELSFPSAGITDVHHHTWLEHFFAVLGIKPGVVHMLGKCRTTESHPQCLGRYSNFHFTHVETDPKSLGTGSQLGHKSLEPVARLLSLLSSRLGGWYLLVEPFVPAGDVGPANP
jgi:hypothetical protein